MRREQILQGLLERVNERLWRVPRFARTSNRNVGRGITVAAAEWQAVWSK